MKSKYRGLICVVLFSLSTAACFCYGIYLANHTKSSAHMIKVLSVPRLKIPDRAIIDYIEFLTPVLPRLGRLCKGSSTVDLKLFRPAVTRYKTKKPGKTEISQSRSPNLRKPESQATFPYKLTLSFDSAKNNFCVIDKKLYKEQQTLPDGGKILKIEKHRVLILKHNQREWIYP